MRKIYVRPVRKVRHESADARLSDVEAALGHRLEPAQTDRESQRSMVYWKSDLQRAQDNLGATLSGTASINQEGAELLPVLQTMSNPNRATW